MSKGYVLSIGWFSWGWGVWRVQVVIVLWRSVTASQHGLHVQVPHEE